ncbi:MAG: hypothetical protein RL238_2161 [Actinomycetota bacterium]|jgi:hypothetical protein
MSVRCWMIGRGRLAGAVLAVLGLVALAGCQEKEPYRLHLRTDADGALLVGVSNCRGDGYEGSIVGMTMTVAALDDHLAGRAEYLPVDPPSNGVGLASVPADLVDQLTGPVDTSVRSVVAVEFSLIDSAASSAPHSVSVALEDAVAELGGGSALDDESWCTWATAP